MSNYHVDFQNMYFAYHQMMNNGGSKCEALKELQEAIEGFNNWNGIFTGMSAEALKSYFTNIHFPIIYGIGLLNSTHLDLYKQYLSDYCFKVDGDGSFSSDGGDKRAVFDTPELEYLARTYASFNQKTQYTEDQLNGVLNSISDLFSYSRSNTEPMLENYHQQTIKLINEVHDNVDLVESEHVYKDFVETEQMISSLTTLIREVYYKNRDFKTSFSEESLMEIANAYNKFGEAFVSLSEKNDSIDKAKLDAFDSANERFLQEYKEEEEAERKRREAEANAWKWTGIVLGVVVGGAVIIASGGTATPVVAAIAGGLAAGTTAFCDSVADNVIKNGSAFKNMDWGHLAKNVIVNAGVGAIAGFVGGAAAQKVGDIGQISRLTQSTNFGKKVLGNICINGAKELSGGVAKRFSANLGESVIEGKTVEIRSAISDAFDFNELKKDAVKGTASGIMKTTTSLINTGKMARPERMFIGGIKGAMEDGASGAVSRGVGEIIDEGLSDKVWVKVIDAENQGRDLIKDIVGGGVKGAAGEYVQVREADINEKNAGKYTNDVIKDPEQWVKDGGTIRRTITGKLIYDEKQVYNTPKSKVGSYSYNYKNGELKPNKYISNTSSYRPSQYNGYYIWPQGSSF